MARPPWAWAGQDNAGSVLVYLATRDVAGTWKRPRDVDDAFSIPQGYARGVQIAFGPRGGSLRGLVPGRRRRETRCTPRGAVPTARGRRAGGRRRRLSTPGAQGYLPKIAVGPEGSVVVVWSEHEGDGPMRIAARRTGAASEPWGPIRRCSRPRPARTRCTLRWRWGPAIERSRRGRRGRPRRTGCDDRARGVSVQLAPNDAARLTNRQPMR